MSPPSAGLLAWLLGKGVCLFCILSKLQPGKHTSSVWFMILWKCETLVVILCMIQNSSKSCQQKLYSFNRTTGTTNYHVRRQLNNCCKMKALKIKIGWIIICWVGRSGRDRGSPIYSVKTMAPDHVTAYYACYMRTGSEHHLGAFSGATAIIPGCTPHLTSPTDKHLSNVINSL